MKKAAASLLVACARKPADPSAEFSTIGFSLQLPSGMQHALEAAEPGFRRITPDKFRADVAQQSALGSQPAPGHPAQGERGSPRARARRGGGARRAAAPGGAAALGRAPAAHL